MILAVWLVKAVLRPVHDWLLVARLVMWRHRAMRAKAAPPHPHR